MSKDIKITVYRQPVTVHLTGDGGGSIDFPLYETCRFCGESHCYGECPDAAEYISDRDMDMQKNKEEELKENVAFNGMMDGISSFVLALAVAGENIEDPKFIEALNSAVEACGNNS